MRFFANGPSIPDELLIARDEGRVIFFCGAGVSRAYAGLSDFFGLAQNVIETLGVEDNDPAKKLIKEANEIEARTGLSGLISADRVFSLLERDFPVRDIESAVANALKPKPKVNLSAHKIMLDLATTPDGKTRLVTTNFDLLFEKCDSSLSYFSPPRLPDPQQHEDLEGIIHLHGHVNKGYKGAAEQGFVLTSSEFGRAYLSDGWATKFILSILNKYFVIFVGYAAEDPPVHYLLEALNSHPGTLEGVYSFQSGTTSEAEAKWRHKGVQPIAYKETKSHQALWDTLSSWSNRAKDPEAWHNSIIDLARKGPESLLPHEKGQVVHLVSTVEGARKFSDTKDPPPAEWLCVFDPSIRYSTPCKISKPDGTDSYFDPFSIYGLDSDPAPTLCDPEDYFAKRDIPDGVWSCFQATRLERQDLNDDSFPALRGHWSINIPYLSPRLRQIGFWIAEISNQPAAAWWASGQIGLHGEITNQIRHKLEHQKKNCSFEVRKTWRYIFEAWGAHRKENPYGDWFDLKASIDLDGWNYSAIRELARINQPYLNVSRPYSNRRIPPNKPDIPIRDMANFDVEYPKINGDFIIPDEFLLSAVREFRKNLEIAIYLEKELGGYGLDHISPIEPNPDLDEEPYQRSHGISRIFLIYIDLFKRLLATHPFNATQESLAWWSEDNTIFARLKIWAAGDQRLLSGPEAGKFFYKLNDGIFWNHHHQRDLLLALAKRWNNFSMTARKRLEKKILRGRSRFDGETKVEYTNRKAWLSLNRIHWMKYRGLKFSFDIKVETSRLSKAAPKWKKQYAKNAANSTENKSGFVGTDKEYSPLLSEPLSTLLSKAKELSGRTNELFTQNDPFSGLSEERPTRAFSALINHAKRRSYPEWAWNTFLSSTKRENDKPKLTMLIAERISRMPQKVIIKLIYSISEWLLSSNKILFSDYPEQFELVWAKLTKTLKANFGFAESTIVSSRNKEIDWATEALNAPVGKMAEVLMRAPIKPTAKKGFPPPWINHVDELLILKGNLRQHALVMFTYRLNWFLSIDPLWTEKNLISALNQDQDNQDAFWAGFFWRAERPIPTLYKLLKPFMFKLATQQPKARRRHTEILSSIILAGWGSINKETGKRYVTSIELRNILINTDENFRLNAIWQLKTWLSGGERNWKRQLPLFLKEVWPRHKKAKSPAISSSLCELAISDATIFPKIIDTILVLADVIDQSFFAFSTKKESINKILESYPQKLLELIFTILPEKASTWPYGIEKILEQIGKAKSSLMKDSRLIELKRRWNSR